MLEQHQIHNWETWIISKAGHWTEVENKATDESIAGRQEQIWRIKEKEEVKEEITEEISKRRRWYEFLGQCLARKNWIWESRTWDAQ